MVRIVNITQHKPSYPEGKKPVPLFNKFVVLLIVNASYTSLIVWSLGLETTATLDQSTWCWYWLFAFWVWRFVLSCIDNSYHIVFNAFMCHLLATQDFLWNGPILLRVHWCMQQELMSAMNSWLQPWEAFSTILMNDCTCIDKGSC